MNQSTTNTRFIQFSGNTIKFVMENESLLDAIDAHFAHCRGVDENVIAEYQVRAESDSFSILRDGQEFQSNINFERVLFQLMQDGLAKLNGEPKTDLILHAAALAQEDRGLLLCGKSGSGKSTLAAWLTANGYQYLTDEVVTYPIVGGEVSGFCRSLVLKRGSSTIWEPLLMQADPKSYLKLEDGSVWIPPTLLNPSAVRQSVTPQVLLFPTYSKQAEFSTERLSLAGTVFMMMQCFVNARNFSDHGMAAVKEFSKSVTAYRLTYSDLDQASAWIQKTLTT